MLLPNDVVYDIILWPIVMVSVDVRELLQVSNLTVKDSKVGGASAVATPTIGRGRGRATTDHSSATVDGTSQQAPPTSTEDAVPQDESE